MIFRCGIRHVPVFMSVLLAWTVLSGCASVRMDVSDLSPPICLNDPTQIDVLVLKHFKENVRAHFGLFGLATWKDLPLGEVLMRQAEEHRGNGIINVSVTSEFSVIDILFGLPLSPFWFARSYTIEGDVVVIQTAEKKPLPALEF